MKSFNRVLLDALQVEMQSHVGRDKAIKSRKLAELFGVDERTLRDAMGALIETRKIPLGSHPTVGFFLIEDRKDRELACRHLRSRGLKILRRLSILEKRPVRDVATQLSLDLETGVTPGSMRSEAGS